MTNDTEKAYAIGLRYLAPRARSVLEMQAYLKKKGISPDGAAQAIERLMGHQYMDDSSFARLFIENRLRFKPKSKYALGYELRAKRIDTDLSDELLGEYNDMDLAMKAIQPKLSSWQHLPGETRQKKIMNYLGYRGFDHGTCMAILEKTSP